MLKSKDLLSEKNKDLCKFARRYIDILFRY